MPEVQKANVDPITELSNLLNAIINVENVIG